MADILLALQQRWQSALGYLSFSSPQKKSLLAMSALVLLASLFLVSRGGSTPITAPAPLIIAPVLMTIDVAGAVEKPGVYSLPADSRVVDAISAAGGAKPGTDLSDINMARMVKDGEQIYVEPVAPPASVGGAPISRRTKRTGPININRASAKELDALPGIGPVIASRIIAYRKANGPFSVVEDLLKVSGIGPAKFAQFKSKVRA